MASANKFFSKGRIGYFTKMLQTDISIKVDDIIFHLHKFPLMSKSRKLRLLMEETEELPLLNFPGGSETFQQAAEFCYGLKTILTPSNVVPLRCAGEYLQIDNLITRTERFLTRSVLISMKDAVKALHSCEKLLPMAEELDIVQNLVDFIAANVNKIDPRLYGRAIDDEEIEENTTDDNGWLEELGHLNIQSMTRLIFAMRNQRADTEILACCLIVYARKHFPGISRVNRNYSSSTTNLSEQEQRELLEFVVDSFPDCRSSTITMYLFGLLRTVNFVKVSVLCRAILERKIGAQLDQANLNDLLIPSHSYANETLYDVECIERILSCFLQGLENITNEDGTSDEASSRFKALILVAKLVDGYLSEIASDPNLKPKMFWRFAVSLPDHARSCDDGLYSAVDIYLKAHPLLLEAERDKICDVLNCKKLTLEACTHATQNEMLPLRFVVRVLHFEQFQLRQALKGSLLSTCPVVPPMYDPLDNIAETVGDNEVNGLSKDGMRSWIKQLKCDCSSMRQRIEKVAKLGSNEVVSNGNKKWKKITKHIMKHKFGCKFNTHVCESHEPANANNHHQ